jgi:hypothetical protein
MARRKTLNTCVPVTPKNSASAIDNIKEKRRKRGNSCGLTSMGKESTCTPQTYRVVEEGGGIYCTVCISMALQTHALLLI